MSFKNPSVPSRHLPAVAIIALTVTAISISVAPASAQPPARDLRPIFALRAASSAPELAVSFEESAVAVTEVTAGGDVVFFSVAREPQGFFQRVVRRVGVVAADALGEARLEPDPPGVPLKSVWAVVDLATGRYGVAAPAGFSLREVPFPGKALEAGAPGIVNRLRNQADAVDLLVVRPGVGAWTLSTWDLASEDHDGEDNDQVLASLGDLQAVEASGPPPPERFARDDVVVVILPETLRYYATRLVGPPAVRAP